MSLEPRIYLILTLFRARSMKWNGERKESEGDKSHLLEDRRFRRCFDAYISFDCLR